MLGMRAEYLKAWLQEATLEKYPTTRNRETVASITQVVLQEIRLTADMT